MEEKVCTKCHKNKSLDQFVKNQQSKDGLTYWCKSCYQIYQKKRYDPAKAKQQSQKYRIENLEIIKLKDQKRKKIFNANPENKLKTKNRHLKNRYNISLSEYNDMLYDQNFCCKICKDPEKTANKLGGLVVDHDHSTGLVRGLLCPTCNLVLGYAKDSITIFLSCINYLKGESYEDRS